MNQYEQKALSELTEWRERMQRPPSFFNQVAKGAQTRINRIIPEKIHEAFTTAIKQMTRAVIFGAEFTTTYPEKSGTLEQTETNVRERIRFYRNAATVEGTITGAGGILLGLADFPLWLTLKMKMLFEVAALYGFDTSDFRERIYLLNIFQLTFSSQRRRNELIFLLLNWKTESQKITDIHQFDWRTFQLEYRDSIDLAKLLQLVPGIGAAVGAIANHRLTDKLGNTAMNAFRMRWFDRNLLSS